MDAHKLLKQPHSHSQFVVSAMLKRPASQISGDRLPNAPSSYAKATKARDEERKEKEKEKEKVKELEKRLEEKEKEKEKEKAKAEFFESALSDERSRREKLVEAAVQSRLKFLDRKPF